MDIEQTEKEIKEMIEAQLPLIDPDSDFLFSELDSLGITTIIMMLSDKYGIELTHTHVTPKNFRNTRSLAEMVQTLKEE